MNYDNTTSSLGTFTRKDLKLVAAGNITIEEILNRSVYDDGFPSQRFSVLEEATDDSPMCYEFTWENGICKYGKRCRYIHNPEILLRSFDGQPVCAKSSMPNLRRVPLTEIIHAWTCNQYNPHSIMFIEYQSKVVWYREGGKSSRSLWEKCWSKILIARPSLGVQSSIPSIPDSIKLLELLKEENYSSLFRYLDICDIHNLLAAFGSSSHIREERTCLLSNFVWETCISRKWSIPLQHEGMENSIQRFLSLKESTMNAHAFLVSSTMSFYSSSLALGTDPSPSTGIPALTELSPKSTPGKTIQISEDGFPVCDIRYTDSLVATVNSSEVSVFRRGDFTRISSCKQKFSCDRVTVPQTHDGSLLIHAGPSGIYMRDLYEPDLKIISRINSPVSSEICLSLDATQTSIFAGYSSQGLFRINSETTNVISNIDILDFVTCKMWSPEGNLHLWSSMGSGLNFWDIRSKMIIPVIHQTGPFAFSSYSSHIVALGDVGIDIRKPDLPLWKIPTVSSVLDVSMIGKSLTIFSGSSANPLTTISCHDISAQSVWIGEHVIPYRVSALGYPSTGQGVGCVFAVRKPKPSGRGGDVGVLCIGGTCFLEEKRNEKKLAPTVKTSTPKKPQRRGQYASVRGSR